MIGVTGATGLVGRHLLRSLRSDGIETAAFTRDPARAPAELRGTARPWPPRADDVAMDAIVNLQGEPVAGRWTTKKKDAIRGSRVEGTRRLVDAISALPAEKRPRVLVSASAIGFYGDRGELILGESASAGSDFLAEVCVAWEREAERAEALGVRVVRVRIGLVMSKDGGALERMLPVFKLGLGGTMGSGDQWWPWIHLDDLIGTIRYAIDHDDVRGPINGTAPEPVRQREFASTLAKVLHRPGSSPPPRSPSARPRRVRRPPPRPHPPRHRPTRIDLTRPHGRAVLYLDPLRYRGLSLLREVLVDAVGTCESRCSPGACRLLREGGHSKGVQASENTGLLTAL
jgi:hypothetical protein